MQNTARSFLADPAIIEASRKFICVRLATYENKAEAEVLKRVFTGRGGDLENTVFCLLSPDGERKLVRAGRSPLFSFGRDETTARRTMVQTMQRLARRYTRKGAEFSPPLALPALADLRLALNVAACDDRPLVIGFAPESKRRAALRQTLRQIAWHSTTVGRAEYVMVTDAQQLRPIKALREAPRPGIYVIRPGVFGDSGEVLRHVAADAETAEARRSVLTGIRAYRSYDKDRREHTELGRQLGKRWKTAIPVTDSRAARRRR